MILHVSYFNWPTRFAEEKHANRRLKQAQKTPVARYVYLLGVRGRCVDLIPARSWLDNASLLKIHPDGTANQGSAF